MFQKPKRVIVVGGGLQGVHIAYYLRHRYDIPEVIIVERSAIAAAASSKGGGFLARAWGDGITQPLHEIGFDEHASLAKTLGVQSFRYLPTAQVEHRHSEVADSAGPAPWLDGAVRVHVLDEDTAQVHPGELCRRVFMESGAELLRATAIGVLMGPEPHTPLRGVRLRKDEPIGTCEHTEMELLGDAVVFTSGPWLGLVEDWLPGVSLPTEGIRSTSFVLEMAADARDRLLANPWACFCGEESNGTHLELYPRNDGSLYVCGLGGSDHVRGARLREDGDHGSPEKVLADEARVLAACAVLERMAPGIMAGANVVQKNACMRPCSPDGLPFMGRAHTDLYPNAFVSGNFNCWGILHAPAQGLAMAELVATGKCSLFDIKPFSPMRYAKRSKSSRGRSIQGQVFVGETW